MLIYEKQGVVCVDGLVLARREGGMEGAHMLMACVNITAYSVEGGGKRHLIKLPSLFLFARVVRPGFTCGDPLDLLNFGEDELKSPMVLVAVA
jgi:hypothetical protein